MRASAEPAYRISTSETTVRDADATLDFRLDHTGIPPFGGTVRYAGRSLEFPVDPEFGSRAAAREQVDRYASAFGRLPLRSGIGPTGCPTRTRLQSRTRFPTALSTSTRRASTWHPTRPARWRPCPAACTGTRPSIRTRCRSPPGTVGPSRRPRESSPPRRAAQADDGGRGDHRRREARSVGEAHDRLPRNDPLPTPPRSPSSTPTRARASPRPPPPSSLPPSSTFACV